MADSVAWARQRKRKRKAGGECRCCVSCSTRTWCGSHPITSRKDHHDPTAQHPAHHLRSTARRLQRFREPRYPHAAHRPAGARRHALLFMHHAESRVPALARVDTHRPASAHPWRVGQRRRPRPPSRRARLRRHARARRLRHGLSRQGAFLHEIHVRADRHARMQQEPGAIRSRVVRTLHGLRARRALRLRSHAPQPASRAPAGGPLRALARRARP